MNKRIKQTISLILIISTVLTGCEKSKKGNPPQNTKASESQQTGVPAETGQKPPENKEYLLKYPENVPAEYNDEANREPYSYSAGRDENGYWDGFKATDYVTLFKYTGFEFPPEIKADNEWRANVLLWELIEDEAYAGFDSENPTDEMVTQHFSGEYGWTTVTQMRDELDRRALYNGAFTYLKDYIAESAQVDIPEEFMTVVEERMIEYARQDAADREQTFEEYITEFFMIDNGIRGFVEHYRENNVTTAKEQLVFQAIAEDMGLNVTDADIDDYCAFFRIKDREAAEEERGLPSIKQNVMQYMVINHIINNAVYLENQENEGNE